MLYLTWCKKVETKPNSAVLAEMEGREGEAEADTMNLNNNYVGKKVHRWVLG